MNDPASAVERLEKELEALKQRVALLEKRVGSDVTASVFSGADEAADAGTDAVALSDGSGLLSLFGRAMLAIAGAYLLRAATAYGAVPKALLVTVAIAYAFVWLMAAARSKSQSRIVSLVWASTSVVICLPMIWELTLRFRILPEGIAAGIVSAYAVAAVVVGWNRHFGPIASVVLGSTSVAAAAMAIATHNLLPFIAALLVVSGLGEFSAARGRALRVRVLCAMAVDVAVFAMIWVYSGPASSRAVYPAVPMLLLLIVAPALLFLHAGSASAQAILLRRGISIFETVQTLIAFVLTCWSFLSFWSEGARTILGVLCLLSSAVGYALCIGWFARVQARRNYHVYAVGSLALLLAGCFLSLSGVGLAIGLGGCAAGMGFAALRSRNLWLEFHSLALLMAAVIGSGQLLWGAEAFAGAYPAAPGAAVTVAAVLAMVCSIAFFQWTAETWWQHLLVLAGTAVSVFAGAALLVWALVRVGIGPNLASLPLVGVVRTAVACAVALGLAWGGTRWQRKEMAWLAWAALVLGALKLLLEDVLQGHLAFTAVSIFLYAVTLLLVPKLIRPGVKDGHN
ncbi:MAG: hypothetical protein ACP5M4_08170 [Acidobacteriaceae bacterium]